METISKCAHYTFLVNFGGSVTVIIFCKFQSKNPTNMHFVSCRCHNGVLSHHRLSVCMLPYCMLSNTFGIP